MKYQSTDKKYRDIVIFSLALAIILVLLLKKCGNNSGGNTIVKTDTVYIKVKQDTSYIPKIDTVFKPTSYRFKWDTIYLEQLPNEPGLYVDTCNYTEFYSTRIYRDTLKNKYGNIYITDSVSQNKIQGRGVKTYLLIPEITNTITLTQPKRNALFIGANLLGSETDIFKGYNVNLSLKTKQDRMIEIGYNQLFGGEHYYSLGLKWKISFRKN